MALGFYFAPAAMTAEKYDECIKLLKKAGAGNPAGRTYHAAYKTDYYCNDECDKLVE